MSNCTYGPPMDSDDSDSSYDGFYFSDKMNRPKPAPYVHPEQKLYDAVLDGDFEAVVREIKALLFHVDDSLKDGPTILMYACMNGQYELAEYLVEKLSANVNRHVDSVMPLMLACDCQKKDAHLVDKLVRLLLRNGAVINVSDKYGMTPFMFACRNGFTSVVRMMIKEVSFDAVDNKGCTPIFHAIEHNHIEVVKILVEAGVNVTIANNKGYTPTQVAECHGYYDLIQLLPQAPSAYLVPSHFLGYSTLRDQIPRLFLKSDCPEYFQELNCILQSMEVQNTLRYFAEARISLAEFLVMDEQSLKEIGIEFPIYRNKIMKGILDFHLHHWSKKSIARVKKDGMDNFYEILMIAANHLQQLVILQASLQFVLKNQKAQKLGQPSETQLTILQSNLQGYRDVINEMSRTVKYLGSFSPHKNPLYIDFNDIIAERKRKKVRNYFKYTTILLGISVFICLKCKWFQ
ncbi:ankyrin repeat, SAM and basic leucine zipper domain-containing protein 1 [Drosophila bipectinata]|uniref:ankyrin repeat, SAM and basic leucine zipper domain-containing protein 1 n=1 Tax=Drosophila bipectinata TaxID=42026 RepID=UPI001C8AC597|nr:uncharacterized protein LOC108119179 [Drosophila bipectinata]